MPPPTSTAQLDGISVIGRGMHSGIQPRLLPPDQLAFAVNLTSRNGLPRTRPNFRKVALTYADGTTQTRATKALFQDASFYQAYGNGESCLISSIGGRIFRYLVGTTGSVQDISLANDLNSSINPDAWMWQSEDFLNINNGQSNTLFFDGSGLRRSLGQAGQELPVGCMGVYVQGRNWVVLPSGQKPSQTFMGSDLVYSHGFNDGYGGRSACLKTEENTLLSGGGAFSVPVSAGPITAMASVAIADTSLGQGPLQVMTKASVFSVQVPLERTAWADTQYPLMTIGLPNYGAIGAWAVATVNGDLWYRSQDGIRSYQVARRDFNTWVNTPLSVEMDRVINADSEGLLDKTSTVLFDNRLLITCSPYSLQGRGTVHRGLIAMDFNNISNLTTRSNPVYDGLWTGMQVLKVVKGTFNGIERCFAFALDCNADICLYEILADGLAMFDWDGTQDIGVESWFESRSMGWADNGNKLKKLLCADLYLDKLAGPGTGNVSFDFRYHSDEDPFWAPWHAFNLCVPMKDCSTAGCPTFQNVREQYRTYLRLPDPSDRDCSKITHRTRRTGYEFQIRMWGKGSWQLNRLHVWADTKSDSVVQGCPTSQNCSLVPCIEETGVPGGTPGEEVPVGIVWEGGTPFIPTEGGIIIRTEDQPPGGSTIPGGGVPTPGGGGGNPPPGPAPMPALPSWPIPIQPLCVGEPTPFGPCLVQDTVTPYDTQPVAINPGAMDPVTYLATFGPPGCLQAWAQETWNQFLAYAAANNVIWTQARLVWATTALSGWQAQQVFPSMIGPFNLVALLNTTIVVEYCL